MANLICTAGPNLGDIWEVHLGTTTIGRHASNNIVLHDKKVSRHHAVLKFEDDRYVISDKDSLNGITIYGKRITQSVVALETPIQMGNTTLLLTRKSMKNIGLQHVEAVGDDLFLKHKSKEVVMSEILEELAAVKGKAERKGLLAKLLKREEKPSKLAAKKKGLGMRPKN